MPLILGANSLTGGYEIDNSLRFNHGSSDELARTMGTATDGKKCTISFWIKKCRIEGSTTTVRFMQAYSGVGNQFHSQWGDGSTSPGDQWDISPGEQSGNAGIRMTNATYRDPSAWYHYLWYWDSVAQLSTLYVNGEAQSSSINDAVVLNQITSATKSVTSFRIQSSFSGEAEFYLAEFYIIDGQALDPTNFGEFDEDSGIWKPIAYEGTYGTNGFYLEFKDSSALGDDTSGNGNDFTVYNLTSIDQTTDTPTNSFATFNALTKNTARGTLSNGNLTYVATDSNWSAIPSSIGVSSGKWYAEFKFSSSVGNDLNVGIIDEASLYNVISSGAGASDFYIGKTSGSYGYFANGNKVNTASSTAYGASYTNGDIVGVALDMDAGTIVFYKNGASQGTAFTGLSGTYFIGLSTYKTGEANFGNAPFTITTGNADANGYGNFEYAVPTGYYALNTKNLAEFG